MVTIATHNGSSAHRDHNIRNEKVVSKEEHIDKGGVYEIWKDETPRQAYHKLFDKAVKDYNDKQTREYRKIKNYYSQIEKDEKKHPVYEMIIGVYPSQDETVTEETQRAILKEFVDNWQERNPNLYMCGAYYHADEKGEPHCHIDYIPVAHGYQRGMETQTGLVKALGEQGIEKVGKLTAQILWQQKENEYLTKLCKERGLEVFHPQTQKQHLETKLYKLTKEIEEKQLELKITKEVKPEQKNIIKTNLLGVVTNKDEIEQYIQELQNTIKYYQEKEKTLREAYKSLEDAYNVRRDAERVETIKQVEIKAFNEKKEQHNQMIKTYRQILAKAGIEDPYKKQQRQHKLER